MPNLPQQELTLNDYLVEKLAGRIHKKIVWFKGSSSNATWVDWFPGFYKPGTSYPNSVRDETYEEWCDRMTQ